MDAIDIRILGALQEDASRPVSEIAERAFSSHNTCWRRIKRLEDEGVIRKRVALLDAGKLGLGATIFVLVRAGEHSTDWLDAFAAVVRRIPEVVEFYRLSGDLDYLLKVHVPDIAAYDGVYKRLIGAVRLSDVSAAFVMEELKHTTALPLGGAVREAGR